MRKNKVFFIAITFLQAFVLSLSCGMGQAFALSDCSLSNGASFTSGSITTTTLTIGATFTGTTNNGVISPVTNFVGVVANGMTVSMISGTSWTNSTISSFAGPATAPTSITLALGSETHGSRGLAATPTITGAIAVGQTVFGTGVSAETTITAAGNGTNTWTVSPSQTAVAGSKTTSYDLSGSSTASPSITSLLRNGASTYTVGGNFIYLDDGTANDHEAWLSSNAVWDAKMGSSTVDPSKQVATASVANGTSSAAAVLAFNYGGTTYSWNISPVTPGSTSTAGAGSSFNFCAVGGGTVQTVTGHTSTK